MSNLGEPELLRVRTFTWNLEEPEFSKGTFMWNLGTWTFLRVEPGEPGARWRAAAPNHPEALLEEP